MELIHPSLNAEVSLRLGSIGVDESNGLQVLSAVPSALWTKEIQFRKADSTSASFSPADLKCKYRLLQPVQRQLNPVAVPVTAFKDARSTGTVQPAVTNGSQQKETQPDEMPAPKIRIESINDLPLEWQKVSTTDRCSND